MKSFPTPDDRAEGLPPLCYLSCFVFLHCVCRRTSMQPRQDGQEEFLRRLRQYVHTSYLVRERERERESIHVVIPLQKDWRTQ